MKYTTLKMEVFEVYKVEDAALFCEEFIVAYGFIYQAGCCANRAIVFCKDDYDNITIVTFKKSMGIWSKTANILQEKFILVEHDLLNETSFQNMTLEDKINIITDIKPEGKYYVALQFNFHRVLTRVAFTRRYKI